MRRGHHESFAVERIEPLRNVARQFQMLRLIVSHRHNRSLIQQDVRSHQHRILKQPIADRFLRLRFGFVLRHALQPAHRRDASQHPRQFGMLRHGRLQP